jgi:hypothetical protein
LRPADPALGLPPDARLVCETDLFSRFFADYREARHPKDAASVAPPKLSPAEIDALLEQIELWNLRR